jgi:hypothetical protein
MAENIAHIMDTEDSKLSRDNRAKIIALEAFKQNMEQHFTTKLNTLEAQQQEFKDQQKELINIVSQLKLQMIATDNSQQIVELKQEVRGLKEDIETLKKDSAIRGSWEKIVKPIVISVITAPLSAACMWILLNMV